MTRQLLAKVTMDFETKMKLTDDFYSESAGKEEIPKVKMTDLLVNVAVNWASVHALFYPPYMSIQCYIFVTR
jgi:hypothetical protein